jgi:CubicO group peptidase (beta-lactamase class C family)
MRGCRGSSVRRLEAISDGEGARADLPDRHQDPNPIPLAKRSVIVCLGMHEREQDLALADQAIERDSRLVHECLVCIVRMAEEVAEEKPPCCVRVVQANAEGIDESGWIHIRLRRMSVMTEENALPIASASISRGPFRPLVLCALMLLAPWITMASEPRMLPDAIGSAEPAEADPSTFSDVPIPAGRVEAALARLDAMAMDALERTGIPGMAIAVVHRDRVAYLKGFGLRSLDGEARVDVDTVFQLASLSKPISATVVAAAIGRGRIAWDDPVVRHLPEFALSDPQITPRVTIADLFAHRSGLPDHAGDILEDVGYGREEIIGRLRFLPLAPFRATYAYTNFGLTAAAEAAARAQGIPWETLTRELLYAPLGMDSTSSRFADYDAAPNRAIGHVRQDGAWGVTPEIRRPDAQSPAGGVSSSVADMAQWMRLVLDSGRRDGEPIIGSEAFARIYAPNLASSHLSSPSSRPSFYGLGLGVNLDSAGRVRWSHSGAFLLGAATTVAMLPSESLGILVLTNGQPVGVPEGIAAAFLELVETGKVQHDWLGLYAELMAGFYAWDAGFGGAAADPAPARAPETYVGRYANPFYGPAAVETSEEGLVLKLGPGPTAFPLRHFDGDRFTFRPIGENALGSSGVTFAFEEDRAAAVHIDFLDEDGLGTFRR